MSSRDWSLGLYGAERPLQLSTDTRFSLLHPNRLGLYGAERPLQPELHDYIYQGIHHRLGLYGAERPLQPYRELQSE